jgi:NADH dehydrogenase
MNMNIPDVEIPRIVIIGGGFGGVTLAQDLKNRNFQVVLLDKNNYHTFQPLLYQVATAGLEPDSIAYPLRKLFEDQPNLFFRWAEAKRIDAVNNQVETNIGPISYDYLVIASGSDTNFFGLNQLQKVSMTMKSVSEALDLRSYILQNFESALLTSDLEEQNSFMNFVIVGAGPTGVELAGALAELKNQILPSDYPDLDLRRMKINLVEAADKVLPPMSKQASAKAEIYLKKLGVNVWLNTAVEDYDGELVKIKNGKNFRSKTLIWSAGVKGAIIDGLADDIVERGRLQVNEINLVKNQTNIFAVGDVALMKTEAYPKGHPMVAPVANQQAAVLAKNIVAIANGKKTTPFKYFDKGSMATIGRNRAVVDIHKFRFQGTFAWFVWMFVHLISLVGFRNKIVTFFNWVYNYFVFEKGVRLIIRPYKRKV